MTSEPGGNFQAILAQSRHPSIALARHSELTPIVAPDGASAVVVARRGRTILVPFGPLGDESSASRIIQELVDDSATKTLVVTQSREKQLPMLRGLGFKSEVFGRTYSIHLPSFTDRGRRMMKVRQNIHRAKREGVTVREVAPSNGLSTIIADVSASWIRQKGFHTKKLKLLVGEDTPIHGKASRTFVAYQHGRAVAFVMYSAPDADSESWLYDLTRRSADAPVGTIEAINMQAAHTLREENRTWLHLGLTPFVGISDATTLNESRRLSRLMRLLASHGEALYPARNQERFKLKWNPNIVEPEFISVYPDIGLASLYNVMRLTNMI